MPRHIGLQLVAGGGVCAYLAMITYLEVNLLWDRFGAQRRSNVSDCTETYDHFKFVYLFVFAYEFDDERMGR